MKRKAFSKQDERDLRELLRLLRMDKDAFVTDGFVLFHRYEGDDDPKRIKAQDFVREHTRLWRQSWILPLLQRLLDRAALAPSSQGAQK